MIGCNNNGCKIWLHEECITEDVLRRTYQRLVLKEDAGLKEETDTKTPPKQKSVAGANGVKNPWYGLFEARIINVDKIARVAITDLRVDEEDDAKDESGEEDENSSKKTWEEEIVCLVCHAKIQ